MKFIAIASIAAIFSAHAVAAECNGDIIKRVVKENRGGYVIATTAGKNLSLLGQDLFSPNEWHAGDCIEITDSQDGSLNLFNERTGQTLIAMKPRITP